MKHQQRQLDLTVHGGEGHAAAGQVPVNVLADMTEVFRSEHLGALDRGSGGVGHIVF